MNDRTLAILRRCYVQPFSLQSNCARERAHEVAELASRGLITTSIGCGTFTNHWRVTAAGLDYLEQQGDDV